ncbi:hypothetical protein H5399_00270 [Tessaracoccus sp. MC1627]|uniref:hypothetical protein n=2 Tax=unclassified Tessaracoccus TaxID=2635419 RepID=UPI0015FEFE1E|nr:hypothetical protein [Tessaracoccus sp. MC1627]MBB1511047.1 hypothetical protein [Tessaracoccus sp. MC1627]
MMAAKIPTWRAAADPDDLREYDAFGPWIAEVKDPADLPRRFSRWWPDLEGARYLLKVPRPIDRAKVHPGMDLYESVIAVFPDKVRVLRAGPTDVTSREAPRNDVVATILHTNLLVARWTLLLADGGALDVEYNAVSHPTIAEVDRYVLSHGPGDLKQPAAPVVTSSTAPPKYHFFGSLLLALNTGATERVQPIHVDEPGQSCLNERGRRRRSAGAMILASSEDLVIINRNRTVEPLFRRSNYAYNVTRVPFRRMTSFEIRRPEKTSPPSFTELVLTCHRTVITQAVLTSPDAVADLLAAHGVPSAR